MDLPKYNELYKPLLQAISDGAVYHVKAMRELTAKRAGVTAEQMAQCYPGTTKSIIYDRADWAKTYLKKAGMVDAPKRAHVQITPKGKELLASGVAITNELLVSISPAFAEWKGGTPSGKPPKPEEDEELTPQEKMDAAYQQMRKTLADDLLGAIMGQTPVFFERLVVDLMRVMGYGNGFVTKASGDDGIDGIIYGDKLGFDLIYVQAKRWKIDNMVGKPDVHKFAGAMMGPPKVEKGLFITTARFTQGAKDFARAQHIILVDGMRLAELMIEYGLGVSTQMTYALKRIDGDYFDEQT